MGRRNLTLAIEEKNAILTMLNDNLQDRDNQRQTLEFTNEEEHKAHQQEILRLNEEINDLIANSHVARGGCFDNVLCFIKKNSGEATGSWKNISDGLNFVNQTWGWLANVMIQTSFTNGVDINEK